MRLIDADKIQFSEIDEIGGEYEPYLGCSKRQIDNLPPVTPQEPTDKNFTKADIDAIVKAINEGWELRINEVLDKIRAEIETKYGRCKLVEYLVQYDGICTRRNEMGDIADILQIIDKYKTEVEPQESEENQDD